MNEILIVGGIVLGLWIALVFLRAPSSIAFLSLLIGQLVVAEASDDVYGFASGVVGVVTEEHVKLGLLVLPLAVTLLLMRGRTPSSKVSIDAVPNLFVAALSIVLASTYIAPLNSLLEIATNDQLGAYKGIIVVLTCATGLVSAWMNFPKHSSGRAASSKH